MMDRRRAGGHPGRSVWGDLLRRAGAPVTGVAAGDGELTVELHDGAGALAAVVRVVLKDVEGRHYRATERYGYRYSAPGPVDAALQARIDLVVGVLARIEGRLPADWARPGSGDPARAFAHRFPFASVDRSRGADGADEAQVLVRLTPRCNQDCPFCSAPECAEPSDAEIDACVRAAAVEFPGCLLTLTGGEPTLRGTFDALLATALTLPGVGGVQVQTNAVTFARPGAVERLPSDPRLLFFVSLHAVDEGLYDRITRTTGQLPRALEGLRALVRAGHRVIVNAVVGVANAAHLADLVSALPGLLQGLASPPVHVSVLMCPPHRPGAQEWLLPYEDLVPLLDRAVEAAAAAGVPMSPLVSSTHASIPPCFVSPSQRAAMRNRPVVSREESGYEDASRPWVKAAACRSCEADAHCLGVPAAYAHRFGLRALRPFGTATTESAPRPAGEHVVPVSAASLASLAGLVGEAAGLALGPAGGALVLDLLDPAQVVPPDRPVSFGDLLAAMPRALRRLQGSVVRVRSRAGRPACLFPDVAAEALLGGSASSGSPGGTYGDGCDRCAARPACAGVSPTYARTFGTGELRPFEAAPGLAIDWRQKARWLLVDRPGTRVALARLVPADRLPVLPCTRPWTRLELHDGGTFGPCCADYMRGRHFVPPDAGPGDLWRSDLLRDYRSEMVSGRAPRGCRPTCPVLRGGHETAGRLVLRGGSAEAVDNEIRLAGAILDGDLGLDHTPSTVCVPVTSFCNHDCIMCDCGRRGTLDDQRSASFWAGLDPWIGAGAEVDVNGGEPLASPIFRAFLEALAAADRPPVINLVTNGSLLTPEWLASLPRIPFQAITVSLNAATPETYAAVNRGVPWERVRRNLDALLEARRDGRFLGELTYSMVILKANLAEVRAFEQMGARDGVAVRYLLPQRDLNHESILTGREAMVEAAGALRDVAATLDARRLARWAADARAQAGILEERLAAGLLEPIGNVE